MWRCAVIAAATAGAAVLGSACDVSGEHCPVPPQSAVVAASLLQVSGSARTRSIPQDSRAAETGGLHQWPEPPPWVSAADLIDGPLALGPESPAEHHRHSLLQADAGGYGASSGVAATRNVGAGHAGSNIHSEVNASGWEQELLEHLAKYAREHEDANLTGGLDAALHGAASEKAEKPTTPPQGLDIKKETPKAVADKAEKPSTVPTVPGPTAKQEKLEEAPTKPPAPPQGVEAKPDKAEMASKKVDKPPMPAPGRPEKSEAVPQKVGTPPPPAEGHGVKAHEVAEAEKGSKHGNHSKGSNKKSEKSETPEKSQKSETSEKSQKSEKSEKSQKSGHPTGGSGKPGKHPKHSSDSWTDTISGWFQRLAGSVMPSKEQEHHTTGHHSKNKKSTSLAEEAQEPMGDAEVGESRAVGGTAASAAAGVAAWMTIPVGLCMVFFGCLFASNIHHIFDEKPVVGADVDTGGLRNPRRPAVERAAAWGRRYHDEVHDDGGY